MPVTERVALLDHSYHQVLSFNEGCLAAFESRFHIADVGFYNEIKALSIFFYRP
jgi:hypothetical protein